MKFRKKPVVIEATQWFKNGDHPADRFGPHGVEPEGREGLVVRYFRHPPAAVSGLSGKSKCEQCNKVLRLHGWIDTLEMGHRVCPGDFIITGVKGERYPCKPDIFEATYEAVSEVSAPSREGLTTPTAGGVERWSEDKLQGWQFDSSFHAYSVTDHIRACYAYMDRLEAALKETKP